MGRVEREKCYKQPHNQNFYSVLIPFVTNNEIVVSKRGWHIIAYEKGDQSQGEGTFLKDKENSVFAGI